MAVDREVLLDPLRNKGTAFSEDERTALGLHGILPVAVESVEQQVSRAYASFQEYETALEKHIYLREVQDTNEVLFYRLIADHVAEMLPIIYTPTVALACQVFSRIYRRPRGLLPGVWRLGFPGLAVPVRSGTRQAVTHRTLVPGAAEADRGRVGGGARGTEQGLQAPFHGGFGRRPGRVPPQTRLLAYA